jgi:hypothetical protein
LSRSVVVGGRDHQRSVIVGRSLSVGDRRQLPLLDMAVIITHLSWALHATAATPHQLHGVMTMDLYWGRRGKPVLKPSVYADTGG